MIQAIPTRYNGYLFRSRIEARWAVFFDTLGVKYEYEKEGLDLGSHRYLPDFWLPGLGVWIEIKGTDPSHEEYRKAELATFCTGRFLVMFMGDIPNPEREAFGSQHGGLLFYPGSRLCFRAPDFETIESIELTQLRPQTVSELLDLDDRSALIQVDLGWHGIFLTRHLRRAISIDGWADIERAMPALGSMGDYEIALPRRTETKMRWMECKGCHRVFMMQKGDARCPVCPVDDSNVCRELWLDDRSVRVLTTYQAARSARFEHGETPQPVMSQQPRAKGKKPRPISTPLPKHNTRFPSGSKVKHTSYGEGIVVSSVARGGDEEVTVAFIGKGIKKLLAAFAGLQLVSRP